MQTKRFTTGARLGLFTLLAVAMAMLLASGANSPSWAQRIVNGVRTQGYPTTGALLWGSPGAEIQICSGTMIGCETFLTAAHCVRGESASSLSVYLQHAGTFGVRSITIHPASTDANFPIADLAVLKLWTPVNGIRRTPINQTSPIPYIPKRGTIVGFGVADGQAENSGIKRKGEVKTRNCDPSKIPNGAGNTELICWNFKDPIGPAGQDSNTCFGDSGGPLFLNLGSGEVVAGVTSGGTQRNCRAGDHSYDVNIDNYKAWVLAVGGGDLNHGSCGNLPQVGDAGVTVYKKNAVLDSTNKNDNYSYLLPMNVERLTVTLNGKDNGVADFDLYVKHGSQASPSNFDCASAGSTQFESCVINNPASGTWYMRAKRYSGGGRYQLTATVYCKNGLCGTICF